MTSGLTSVGCVGMKSLIVPKLYK
jgi:hypothetical protein